MCPATQELQGLSLFRLDTSVLDHLFVQQYSFCPFVFPASDAENHLEETTRRNLELQNKLEKIEGDMVELCMEVDMLKSTKKE